MTQYEEKTEDLVLNIPTRMLKDYIGNKTHVLMLGFSCCIKHEYADSRMPNLTVEAIMDLYHCGKELARTINKAIKHGEYAELFAYNPYNNSVVAKNFKKKYIKKSFDKNGKEIWHAPVLPLPRYKLNKETYKYEKIKYTRRNLDKRFRKLLLEDIISRKDKSKDKYYLYHPNLFITSSPTQRSMSKAIGNQSTRTASRRLRELEEEGRIEKYESSTLKYIDNYRSSGNEAVEAKIKGLHGIVIDKKTGSVYKSMPNRYRLIGRDIGAPRFIVFNYGKRLTNYAKKNEDCLNDKWDR